jgi:hypothetical protein
MPRNVQRPRPASAANARDRRQQQLKSITKQKSSTAIILDESSPATATSPRWLISRLDALAELHADAWGGLERFALSLAERGILWHELRGASDLFGSLDKASMLAFQLRRELAEGVDRAVA